MNEAKFRKIVVAYDGSKNSDRAVEVATTLSKEYGADLVLVHVYSLPAISYTGATVTPYPNFAEIEDALKDGAKQVIGKGLDIARDAGGKPKGEIIEAPSTVEALTDFAASEKADLLVVGTRGMGRFKKLVLGSVSSGIVGHATCSVLVVR